MRTSSSPMPPILPGCSSSQKLAACCCFCHALRNSSTMASVWRSSLHWSLWRKLVMSAARMAPSSANAGRGRIWHYEQVFVEPTHFAVGENADLNRGEDIRDPYGARGDLGTACK